MLRPTQSVRLCQGGESVFARGVDWTDKVYGPTLWVVEQFLKSVRPLPVGT
jgi:hypothetical protein